MKKRLFIYTKNPHKSPHVVQYENVDEVLD